MSGPHTHTIHDVLRRSVSVQYEVFITCGVRSLQPIGLEVGSLVADAAEVVAGLVFLVAYALLSLGTSTLLSHPRPSIPTLILIPYLSLAFCIFCLVYGLV